MIKQLKPTIAQAAQKLYDTWDQDEDGVCSVRDHAGGICHEIADEVVDILNDAGFEHVTTMSYSVGENHVSAVVATSDGVYEVDIPPYTYETGGGYNWKKKPDVTFTPNDVVIDRLSRNPKDIENYLEDF